ncbi:AsmA family protein [Erwinia sorbitola]|uniref:AsmA family protein n=1 Tax=Erwinia sorbitola TaxID=2681984 RepID=A0A6I6EWL1_9GAMM|nr:AsmA family protein [Erwinia sorbitola]MTD28833.1 AsmA family protein [Erwinia sorbitola]QGU89509.1 AsmA family protein [Erwinia sorbitola]
MKFLGKVLLTLLLLLLLAIVTLYVLLQTQWGAGWIGRQVSTNSDYQLSLSKMEHDFSNPSHLLLNNVSFGRKGQPATLVAKRVNLGFGLIQFSNPLHFSSIRLEQGTLNLSEKSAPLSLQADRLQLSQMALNRNQGEWPLQAQRVDGGVIPWKPEAGDVLGKEASFQMSAGSLTLKGIPASNVLIQGSLKGRELVFSNLGADIALGSVTASAERDNDGAWNVTNLRLNSIRMQSDKTLSEFLQPFLTLPAVHFERVDVTDARLQGQDWAVTDLDLTLKDLSIINGDWQSDNGSLSMNANSFINGSMQLNDPIANMDFSAQGITLKQFSSRWVNGLVRTQGNWTRSDRKLTLDELVVAGLEYTLPLNWRDHWMQPLPSWLESVEVTRFSANRNLIIDINPDFPFQMTSLDGTGNHLLMARQHQWGIWSGDLSINAAEATFNRVDLRHPSLALNAGENTINVTEMSAFSHEGMLEGLATVSQQPQRALSLTLTGRQVPVNLLHDWGWPQLPLQGNGNLQLKMQGNLSAAQPLKSSVNGTLTLTTDDKSIHQTMVAGQVAGAQ